MGNNMTNRFSNSYALLFTTAILLFFVSTACVSVNLSSPKFPKADNVKFKNPQGSFSKTESENNLDALWISNQTKSTIGFYSICNKNLPPLRNARSNSLNGIEGPEIIKEELIRFNGREALKSIIQGKLEGFLFKIESILFIKNSCLFEISYVSYKENFDQEHNEFQQFLQGFSVP